MARQRAVALRGRRTGVHLPTHSLSQRPLSSSQEPEDIDEVFDGAETPNERENSVNEQSSMTMNGDSTAATKNNKPNNKKKNIRFSLDSTAVVSREEQDEDDASLRRTTAQRLQGKLRNSRGSLSPSELSRVSTAPPSVKRSVPQDEEEIEQVRHGSAEMQDILRSGTPTSLAPSQEDQEQDDFDVASPGSPVPEANDYEEDNFLPPPPESDDDDDDDQAPSQEEVPTQVDHSPVDFPTQLDDDDDDDDKEGEGFAMAESPVASANNPKTPASIESEEEQEPEEHVVKKKPMKNKKRKKSSAPPAHDDDESSQDIDVVKPAKKPRKKKTKQQPQKTIFSPQGIQTGPTEFRAIPVTNEKDVPPEEAGLRRSKRTRVAPLAWWKGERAEYGPNTFPEEIAEQGNVNMAEVKCYLVAEPTPYKPRKPRAPVERQNTSSNKKKGKGAATSHQEDNEEFDSSKLRKKYTYMESDTAYLWDDNWEHAEDMGELILVIVVLLSVRR